MGDIIIYTAITGGYDRLQQPFLPADGFRFICFTDKSEGEKRFDGVWELREIPDKPSDRRILPRYPKLNPHKVLPEDCDYSLWIDGNITIKDDSIYRRCKELASEGVLYAGIVHPFNDCPYAEAEKCLKDRRENLARLFKTVRFLSRNGVPEHSGLMETNLILRKHNDPEVIAFDELWWERLQRYSHRDQLTHTSCRLDSPGLEFTALLPEDRTSRNFDGLGYDPHPSKTLSPLRRKLKYGIVTPARWILHLYIRATRRR